MSALPPKADAVRGLLLTRLLCHSHDWLTAAMNNHSVNLSGVGRGPLATDSGDFALGGDSFAIFSHLASVSDFWL